MSDPRPLLPLLLGVTLLAAGCASSGSPPSGSACTSDLARHDRSLGEAVDSVALARGLAGLWRPGTSLTLASIMFDSVGGSDTTRVISAISERERDAFAREIGRHARPGSVTSEQVDLFIGDARGVAPRRVRKFEACPPDILNRDIVARMLVQEAENLDILTSTTVRLYALVQEDGSVGEVRIDRSSSNIDVDAAAVRIIRRTTFAPARIEGIPTRVWANFPVRFELRPPSPR